MSAKLPVFSVLWIFTLGLVPVGGCGRPTDGADVSPAAVGAEESPPALTDDPAQRNLSQGEDFGPAAQAQASEILNSAVRALDSHQSVSARIRQRIDLFDKQLVGSGVYLQQQAAGDHLIRLELRIQVGDQVSSLLQVLSPPTPAGQYLWTHRKLPGEVKLSRIDVARVAKALQKAENVPDSAAQGMLLGLGGLPKLVRGLQAAFDFDSAQRGHFDGRPVWRIQGQWKSDRLAKMLPDQKAAMEAGEPPDLSKLREHLPDHVVLMLGLEDLFPYRIEYRRGIGEKAGGQNESRALVTMELFEVKFDVPIDRRQFLYNRGNTEFSDETSSFINSLGVAP